MSVRIDPTVYTGRPSSPDGRSDTELRAYDLLDGLGIDYLRLDHEHTDTIEACHEVEAILGIRICKNLFLRNRQGTEHYLLMMPGDKPFKTKFLSKALGVSRLSFAPPEELFEYLGLRPGSVTVLGLMNDARRHVHLVIDRAVLEDEYIGCHPCESTSSLRIRTGDLLQKILPAMGVTPKVIELEYED